jgi:hypothetical protein
LSEKSFERPGRKIRLFLVLGAFSLTIDRATNTAQQLTQRTVELQSHLVHGRFGFAQRGDLQE